MYLGCSPEVWTNMVFLMMYARGTFTTPWHDLRYSLMVSTVPTISDLFILDNTLGSSYSSMSFFWPASRWTVSSFTPITSWSIVHLSHNIADVINILVGENSQHLRNVYSVLSDKQLGCFGTESKPDVHILEPWVHNLRSCSLCTFFKTLQGINLWQYVPDQGIPMSAYSTLEFFSFASWATGSCILTFHSLHPDHSLLWIHHLWHLAVPPAEDLSQACLHLLFTTKLLGIPSWSLIS